MNKQGSSKSEIIPNEDSVGIELLVCTFLNEEWEKQTEKDKVYLTKIYQKTKSSLLHKMYLDMVLGIVIGNENKPEEARNKFYMNASKLESEGLIQ